MDNIYYISQGETIEEHLQNIKAVCEAGCRLVQIRLKNVDHESYVKAAKAAKEICDQYNCALVVNDNAEVAQEVQSTGVHVGLLDKSPKQVRSIVDNEMLLGGTANTLADCLNLLDSKVDYIGLGPLRFTTSKKNLSPVLGFEGYTEILKEIRKVNPTISVYAIGGIQLDDLEELGKTGVSGVSLSGLLTSKPHEELEQIIKTMRLEIAKW